MNKNNKGFTLIELLVTIAIMITILVISIISINNMSKRKKGDAYESVKEEVVTAATNYVESNKYLFTDNNENIYYVPLKVLVNEGYLNKVTNPKTGQPINECFYVKVSVSNGEVKVEDFKEEAATDSKGSCSMVFDSSKVVVVTSTTSETTEKTEVTTQKDFETPKLTLDLIGLKNKKYTDVSVASTGWYNIESLNGAKLVVKGKVEIEKGDSIEIYRCYSNNLKECTPNKKVYNKDFYDKNSYKNDTKYKKTCYMIKSTKTNKSSTTCIDAKVDTVAPTPYKLNITKTKEVKYKSKCPYTFTGLKTTGKTSYEVTKHANGNLVYTDGSCTDKTSDIGSVFVMWNLNETSSKYKNSSVNTQEKYKNRDKYNDIKNAYKFTDAKDGEHVYYKRYCVDNAGNKSQEFSITITTHTEKHNKSCSN